MKQRKGYGLGKGMGYKNLMPMDAHIHSLSAKGVKTFGVRHKQVLGFKDYIDEQEGNEINVPSSVKKYVKLALKKEEFFDEAFAEYPEGKKISAKGRKTKSELIETILRDCYTEQIEIEDDLDDELLNDELETWTNKELENYIEQNQYK